MQMYLKNNVKMHAKVIPLHHHLRPTRSMWQCLYLLRACARSVDLYFLDISVC